MTSERDSSPKKKKMKSLPTHHYADGGVGEVLKSLLQFQG